MGVIWDLSDVAVLILVAMVTRELNTAVLFFCRYGKIVSTKAILDKTTNKCKGELLKNEQKAKCQITQK